MIHNYTEYHEKKRHRNDKDDSGISTNDIIILISLAASGMLLGALCTCFSSQCTGSLEYPLLENV